MDDFDRFKRANLLCGRLCRKYDISPVPKVVPYRGKSFGVDVVLGHWRQYDHTLELNRKLPINEVKHTIQHELAHAKCYQLFPDYDGDHDRRFRKVGRDMGLSTYTMAVKPHHDVIDLSPLKLPVVYVSSSRNEVP